MQMLGAYLPLALVVLIAALVIRSSVGRARVGRTPRSGGAGAGNGWLARVPGLPKRKKRSRLTLVDPQRMDDELNALLRKRR